ncbi:MAG: response regulator [Planctomycetota bacterium]
MSDQTPSRPPQRLLLLATTDEQRTAWLPVLEQHGVVRVAGTPAAALAALRSEHFDVVITPAAELLPLGAVAGREQARSILEGIAQGVCVIDAEGRLLWSNSALAGYPPEVTEAARQACAELLPAFRGGPAATQRRNLTAGDKLTFDLTASALLDSGGNVERIIGVVNDTTSMTRMREKLDAIDAAGRELVALGGETSARMEVPERLNLLENKLIRYCRELLDFTHFAVLVLDPKANQLNAVLAGGFTEQERTLTIDLAGPQAGISGHVAATGQSYICPDVASDARYLPGYHAARSSLTVPLRLNERIVGVLNVESDQPAAFTEADRQVAEIFGRYIAVALHMLKLLVVERSEATGQIAADVRAELSEPLNDIIAEATWLLQRETSAADRDRRLRAIITEVDRVKQVIQELTAPPPVRGLGAEAEERRPGLVGKRVLVADDEDIIRETISDVLTKAGALPVMARDGAEAVAMVRAQHFDLVLSDIKMPHHNGYEIFAAVKEANAGCPVILITGFGYDPEHSIVRASREGLAGVLFKPFKVEQLLELVEKAVG